MLGRGWIVRAQEAEATQVRARIADLEQEMVASSCVRVKKRPGDIGHEIRLQWFRLNRIEECLTGLRGNDKPEGQESSRLMNLVFL
jgi:hypothetical protein